MNIFCQQLKTAYDNLLAERASFDRAFSDKEKRPSITQICENIYVLMRGLDDILLASLNEEEANIFKQKTNSRIISECQKYLNDADENINIWTQDTTVITKLDAEGKKTEILSMLISHPRNRVENLDLSGVEISFSSMQKIIQALNSKYSQVSGLTSTVASLFPECVDLICDELKRSGNKLRSLNLSWNNLGDKGAKKIAEAIENENCLLNVLDMDQTNLTDNGALAMIAALEKTSGRLGIVMLRNHMISDRIRLKLQSTPQIG